MTDVRIELPFPPSGLNPNRKSHYMAKAKIVREYREQVAWTAVASKSEYQRQRTLGTPEGGIRKPLTPPVRAAVTFVVPDRRRRDVDNCLASLKPGFDGLVDAGVLEGDDAARLTIVPGEDGWIRVEKGKSCVIVELRGSL